MRALFIVYSSIIASVLARTNLLVTRVGPCYDNPSEVVSVSEFTVSTKPYDSSLSGDMNITQDIDNGWNVTATMKKCLDIRNIDTCDDFKSFPIVVDGCVNFSEDADTNFNMLYHNTEPSLSCPIQTGKYTITNYPLYTEDNYGTTRESKISTSIFGYTLRLDGFDRFKTKVMCVEAYIQLLYRREHIWTKRKNQDSRP